MAPTETDRVVTYTLTLTVSRPVRLWNTDDTLEDTEAWMVGREGKRELEREVLHVCSKLDGDCDVEVIDHSVEEE